MFSFNGGDEKKAIIDLPILKDIVSKAKENQSAKSIEKKPE